MSAPMRRGAGPAQRSRIVVDLDQARAAASLRASTGRGRRILAIVAAALLVILLTAVMGAFLWWRGFKRDPAYTLALLADASERNDTQTINGIVDVDRVAQNFMPQVTEKALERYGVTAAMAGPLRRQLEAAAQQMLPNLRESVRDEIAHQTKEFAARGANLPFFVLALAVPFAVDRIKEQGNRADVSLKIGDRPVELMMERSGERWKIVGVRDDALVTRLVDNAAKSLPGGLPGLDDLLGSPSRDGSRRRGNQRSPGGLPALPGLGTRNEN